MNATANRRLARWTPVGAALAGVLCVVGLRSSAHGYFEFDLPSLGATNVYPAELAFFALYAFWGGAATVCFTLALAGTRLPDRLLTGVPALLRRPRAFLALGTLGVLLGAATFRLGILGPQPVADDENTYSFIAQTLLRGGIVNTPPLPPEWVANQFVVASERAWFGKYPLGHPLLLALGQLLRIEWLVGPILGAAGFFVAVLVGRRLFGDAAAWVGAALLLLSPQFVWTSATRLSQPTSTLILLLSMWALLRLWEAPSTRSALLLGALLGYGLLVRPFPGAPFAVAFGAAMLLDDRRGFAPEHRTARLRELVAAGAGVLAGAAILLWINRIQAGSLLASGYTALHGGLGLGPSEPGQIANSVAGALIRLNFWSLGWPLSFALLPFVRVPRGALLFWGVILAELSYRVIVPKTVVAATGPVYVAEIVPLLAMASGAGALRLVELLRQGGARRPGAWVLAALLAASIVARLMFVPVEERCVARAGAARDVVSLQLERAGAGRALVFANEIVDPRRGESWAWWPASPSPDLRDDIVFLRLPLHADWGAARALWRERFSDRRAFAFYFTEDGPVFEELAPPPPAPR